VIGVDVASVSKSYDNALVLDAVSASFEAGRLTSLLGPSGSGKTTLLRIIAGFIAPDRGRIHFADLDVTDVPVWKRRIGMVFQSYALFPHMSVHQNVIYGLHRRGIDGATAQREVARVLDLVHLTGFEQRRPKELSGGQQQRVALARAIVTQPQVLLLDEPLSALDRRLRQEMQVELRRIQRESGLTTIFVTHDQEEALTLSDRVAILDRGRIVQEGAPAEIYERPRTRFAASFLGDATLAVRPEKMRLVRADRTEGADNVVAATLREVIYAGAVSTFVLEAADGSEIKVFAQNTDLSGAAIGDRLAVAWPARSSVPVEG
jgi:spermidine/putrescine transport system ATP-binding protein